MAVQPHQLGAGNGWRGPAVAPPAAIKTVCAWCGTVLKDGPGVPVSHGICQPCAASVRASVGGGR